MVRGGGDGGHPTRPGNSSGHRVPKNDRASQAGFGFRVFGLGSRVYRVWALGPKIWDIEVRPRKSRIGNTISGFY